ncbi:MAG: sodium:calcium antiporter [Chloroflexi bacterium]|nr:sodium:calcium antiporter [Chloroflexota bacterium]
MVWIKFLACAFIIFLVGRKVARYGDIIATRTGLGGVWIGLILIAVLTSLPELFNGISAVTLVDAPDLTVGNILGANTFNFFNLAMLDITHRGGSILATASSTHRLTAWLSLVLVLVVGVSLLISQTLSPMALGWIGWYSLAIVAIYLFSIRKIFLVEKAVPQVEEGPEHEFSGPMYLYFAISAAVIIGAGIWLAMIGDEIAAATGWGESFVGSLFLALSTTLPEVTVSYAAIRIGATDMAIANMIGSNLFNITIIVVDDLLYMKGPILASVSESNLVTVLGVVLMTLIFIAGLRFRPRRFFRLNWWNASIAVLFLLVMYINFSLS